MMGMSVCGMISSRYKVHMRFVPFLIRHFGSREKERSEKKEKKKRTVSIKFAVDLISRQLPHSNQQIRSAGFSNVETYTVHANCNARSPLRSIHIAKKI